MTITQLIGQVKNYRQILYNKEKTIGSVIKHYRRDQKLTLEDTATGICSISYLCKVENNQIIPSDLILPKLVDKLKINEDEFNDIYDSNWISEIIENDKVRNEFYLEHKKKTNYRAKLIRYAYTILNENNLVKAFQQFIDITKYLSHFKEEEMCFFLYLCIIICDKKERYSDVLTLCNEVFEFNNNLQVLIKVKLKEIKAVYKLEITSQIDYYYNDAINLFIKYNDYKSIVYLRKYSLAHQSKLITTKKFEDDILSLNNIDEEAMKYFNFCHNYFYRYDYINAYNDISKIMNLNDHYFIMAVITLYKMKKVFEINKLVNDFKLPLRELYMQVLEFITSDDDGKIDFIRSKILTSKITAEEKYIIDFLYLESYNLLKTKYLYKESTLVLERLNASLNNILKINVK